MQASLVDVMGDDLRVVNAARVSFASESEWEQQSEWEWDKGLSEKDQRLIKYLATHNHWTPFSHVTITMREKVPLFVARQRFKHMVGFTYNERSGRYVGRDVEFFTPDTWRKQAQDKKQGSSDEIYGEVKSTSFQVPHEGDFYLEEYHNFCLSYYNSIVGQGVAIEQARMVLPQSMYTEYYATGSLAAWSRAYKLRIAPDAQKEIQDLAKQWNEIISGIPELKYSWAALTTS